MTESPHVLLTLKIYQHSNIMKTHELTYKALIFSKLHDSVAKRIKQQAANRWFAGSKSGKGFKNTVNWNPFQAEFTEA